MTAKSTPRSKRSGYDRADSDWYVEPVWATSILLEQERFDGPLCDPCCGQGNVLTACQEAGYHIVGYDLVSRFHNRQLGTADFFAERPPWPEFGVYNFISNPPYGGAKLATEFIERALIRTRRTVAVIVNESYLFARSRHDLLYGVWPLKRIWMLSSRPSMPPGEIAKVTGEPQKASGGQANYAWLIFDRHYFGEPTVGWLRHETEEASIPIRYPRAVDYKHLPFSPR